MNHAVNTAEKVRGVPMVPGDPRANRAGRPKGSRNRLGEEFLRAMADDFEEHGAEAITQVRLERPQDYLKVIASILPKIISVKTDELEGLSDDELRLAYAREARKLIAFGIAVGAEIAPGDAQRDGEAASPVLQALQQTGPIP